MIRPLRIGLLVAVGLATWAVMVADWLLAGGLAARGAAPAIVLWLLFPAGFLIVTYGSDLPGWLRQASLLAQVLASLGLTAMGWPGVAGVLLVVLAAEVELVLRPRVALVWVALQWMGFTALSMLHVGPLDALLSGLNLGTFQLFALGAAHLARREAEARGALERANAELRATRALLVETSRSAERLRISRELHDAIGHHLTALSLQLEVARNTSGSDPAVLRAQEIAREMLAEVRQVVGVLRADEPLDLRRALEVLVAELPRPHVHLSVSPELAVSDAAAAHAVFRCVQEALTNAVRHARAENLWIEIRAAGCRVDVQVRDDGQGAASLVPGNGLSGLRERLAELGGALEIESAPGQGVRLRVTVPLWRALA